MSSEESKKIIAKNIKYYLNKNNVSQTDICKTLGFGMSTFSDWVHARTYPRIDKIELLADYFKVKKTSLIEDLKKGDDTMPPTKDMTMLKVNSKALLLAMANKEYEPKELAKNAGVSPNVVYVARRGCYVKPKYVGKIAKALDVNVEDITE